MKGERMKAEQRWRIYKQGRRVSIAGPDTATGFTVVPEDRVNQLEAALRAIEQRHGRQVAEAEAEFGHTVPAECGCEDCLLIDGLTPPIEAAKQSQKGDSE
jgi:hypothetical protein